ncbi:MAG: hypothetical protein IJS80_03235, partial [Lachnospiraceae bacterium]|nr:hypothetical protein [Lachnospiraceae bacterium]
MAAVLLISLLLTSGCTLFDPNEESESPYCSFEGCHNKVFRDGMCAEHYLQMLEAENEAERRKLAEEGRTELTATPTPTP